ncbi:MAG: hypothetical protein CXT72_04185 [Methanobacteriota archaeon]|nr:MAG: hypothetical protein CXT72_04185 [Euryarchaeota archaeon]
MHISPALIDSSETVSKQNCVGAKFSELNAHVQRPTRQQESPGGLEVLSLPQNARRSHAPAMLREIVSWSAASVVQVGSLLSD